MGPLTASVNGRRLRSGRGGRAGTGARRSCRSPSASPDACGEGRRASRPGLGPLRLDQRLRVRQRRLDRRLHHPGDGLGYPRALAGAVEAVASSGGQIMPPLMGRAFVMSSSAPPTARSWPPRFYCCSFSRPRGSGGSPGAGLEGMAGRTSGPVPLAPFFLIPFGALLAVLAQAGRRSSPPAWPFSRRRPWSPAQQLRRAESRSSADRDSGRPSRQPNRADRVHHHLCRADHRGTEYDGAWGEDHLDDRLPVR